MVGPEKADTEAAPAARAATAPNERAVLGGDRRRREQECVPPLRLHDRPLLEADPQAADEAVERCVGAGRPADDEFFGRNALGQERNEGAASREVRGQAEVGMGDQREGASRSDPGQAVVATSRPRVQTATSSPSGAA
jgi:hypothetical protein